MKEEAKRLENLELFSTTEVLDWSLLRMRVLVDWGARDFCSMSYLGDREER